MVQKMTLRLCASCAFGEDTPDLTALRNALDAAGISGEAHVAEHHCFGACGAPVALSFQAPGRATYLFSGVNPETDQDDIIATAKAYLDAPEGWIADARSCGRLRFCLVGRVPALEPRAHPQ